MAYKAWICEMCRKPQQHPDNIWNCPGCGEEVCESCFDRLAHCKHCADGKTDEELQIAANEAGFDFE